MIDQITKLPSLKEGELPTMQRILDNVHRSAVGVIYTDDDSTASTLADEGKIVIMDDGVDRKVYFKTGKGFIGSVTLS